MSFWVFIFCMNFYEETDEMKMYDFFFCPHFLILLLKLLTDFIELEAVFYINYF